MSDDTSGQRFATRVIHGGQRPDPLTGAVMPPIYATSTYVQSSPGVHKGFEYSRTRNPTRDALQAALANLEGGAAGLRLRLRHGRHRRRCWSCSTPARTSSPCTTCTAAATGCSRTCASARPGTSVSFVDLSQAGALQAALRPDTRLVWVETPDQSAAEAGRPERGGRARARARHHQPCATTPSPRPSSSARSSTASTSSCTRPPST